MQVVRWPHSIVVHLYEKGSLRDALVAVLHVGIPGLAGAPHVDARPLPYQFTSQAPSRIRGPGPISPAGSPRCGPTSFLLEESNRRFGRAVTPSAVVPCLAPGGSWRPGRPCCRCCSLPLGSAVPRREGGGGRRKAKACALSCTHAGGRRGRPTTWPWCTRPATCTCAAAGCRSTPSPARAWRRCAPQGTLARHARASAALGLRSPRADPLVLCAVKCEVASGVRAMPCPVRPACRVGQQHGVPCRVCLPGSRGGAGLQHPAAVLLLLSLFLSGSRGGAVRHQPAGASFFLFCFFQAHAALQAFTNPLAEHPSGDPEAPLDVMPPLPNITVDRMLRRAADRIGSKVGTRALAHVTPLGATATLEKGTSRPLESCSMLFCSGRQCLSGGQQAAEPRSGL